MGEVCRKGEIEGKRGEKESRGRRRRRGEEVRGGKLVGAVGMEGAEETGLMGLCFCQGA